MYVPVLVFLASALAVTYARCPQPEFVTPCTCRPWENGIYIICHQVNDTNNLNMIFQMLRDYEITRLLLKDCHLNDTTGPGIFSGLNIKLLRLIDCSLTRPESTTRRPGPIAVLAPNLERLDITNSDGLFKIGNISLSSLSKLTDLNVVRDNLTTVRNNWLPPNITNLRLEDCQIRSVESGALVQMPSLKSLTLVKNELTTLQRNVLPANCLELVSIDLSENRIQNLPPDFFSGMRNLHTVNLYENQLHSLDQNIWSPIWSQLDRLWITGNNISCDAGVEWIFDQARNPATLSGICSLPERLAGTAIANLSREALQNRV